MSFYENNLQRVRSNIIGLFNSENESDEGEDEAMVCSRKKKCDLEIKDMIEEEEDEPPSFGKFSDSSSTDDESESEPVELLDDISESELEHDIQHIKDVERDLKILKSNHYPDDSVPVEVEDEETFMNHLIQQDMEQDNMYIKVKEKPYKIEINSGNPDDDEEYPDPSAVKESKAVVEVERYKNFEAFYEQNIPNFTKQLYIFNKIVSNNLLTHPFLSDVVSEFRKHVVQVWVEKFIEADDKYNLNFHEPKKWVQRAESLIFDFHLKQPVIEYVKLVGSLIVLFDVNQTYGLNEHLYKNILNKAVEPLDMKKYDIYEFLVYYRGKNISKVLIQDVKDSVMSMQNIEIINLDINLYNRIFHDTVKPMSPLDIDESLVKKIADYFEHNDIHNVQDILKQPIIYVDPDTHKVYIFDYNKLSDNFNENKFINTFTDKPFEENFVEQCRKKMKNHLLCNYCKDNICDTTKTLKTVYQDPNYGPIVLKFCGIDCFSDIEWKPKVLRNAIV